MNKKICVKYVLTVAFLFAVFLWGKREILAQEAGLRLDSNLFPDASFYEYVKEYVDLNTDGYLSQKEMDAVTELYLRTNDLKGIEQFKNLKLLHWTGTLKEKPDFSQNKNLKTIVCTSYNLPTIDLSENTELREISMRNSEIESLNLSQQTKLKRLNISGSRKLVSLDVSMCPNLEKLFVRNCSLKDLQLGKKDKLDSLDCAHNKLTRLNIKKLNSIRYLDVSNNNLEEDTIRVEVKKKKQLPISKSYFPSKNLRKILKEKDQNRDGVLSKSEIKKINKLVLDNYVQDAEYRWRIDLEGLQYLTHLKTMEFHEVQPENQVVLKKMNIKKVSIEGGVWGDLELGNRKKLEEIRVKDCDGLYDVSLSKFPKLKKILIERCDTEKVELTKLRSLRKLEINCRQLASFNVNNLKCIKSIILMENNLTHIDLSKCYSVSKKIFLRCDAKVKILKPKKMKIDYESTEWYLNPED